MEAPALRSPNVAAAVAGIVVGALVIGIIYLIRPPSTPAAPPSRSTAAQPASTVTAAGTAEAKVKVCNIFHQADAAIGFAINAPGSTAGPDAARAKVGAAVVSGALALTRAVGPATPPDIARPATELADAYSGYALSTYGNGNADPSAVVAATAALRQACG
jgi:hypothetical protein